jgi:cell shape-determining protein MreC
MAQDFDAWQCAVEQDIVEQVRLANLVESLTREIDALARDAQQRQGLEAQRTRLREELTVLRDKYSAASRVEPEPSPTLRRTTTRAADSLNKRKTLDMSKMSFLEKLQYWQLSSQ